MAVSYEQSKMLSFSSNYQQRKEIIWQVYKKRITLGIPSLSFSFFNTPPKKTITEEVEQWKKSGVSSRQLWLGLQSRFTIIIPRDQQICQDGSQLSQSYHFNNISHGCPQSRLKWQRRACFRNLVGGHGRASGRHGGLWTRRRWARRGGETRTFSRIRWAAGWNAKEEMQLQPRSLKGQLEIESREGAQLQLMSRDDEELPALRVLGCTGLREEKCNGGWWGYLQRGSLIPSK